MKFFVLANLVLAFLASEKGIAEDSNNTYVPLRSYLKWSSKLLPAKEKRITIIPGYEQSDFLKNYAKINQHKDTALKTYKHPEHMPDYAVFKIRLAEIAKKQPWLNREMENIISRADFWLKVSDDELWRTIPSQAIARTLWVNKKVGCPICGIAIHTGYGYYPWKTDPLRHPWKVSCPKCNEWFPKNDFKKYYMSGIDEHGKFNPAVANHDLLYNPAYPDPEHPKHRLYVDDGSGWKNSKGECFFFIGCYNLQAYWGRKNFPHGPFSLSSGALNLAYAWIFTGEIKYALKAAVILSRVASLFPDMDYLYWSSKTSQKNRQICGKTLDYIWETFLIDKFLKAYGVIADKVKDHPELTAFLASRRKHLALPAGAEKSNLFLANMEHNYLEEIFMNVKHGIIRGNVGMHEKNIALAALVTWDKGFRHELTKWLFAPRKIDFAYTKDHIVHGAGLAELVHKMTKDGFSWESGGYCRVLPESMTVIFQMLSMFNWLKENRVIAEVLKLYEQRLVAYYKSSFQLIIMDRFKPFWGDNGIFCEKYYRAGVDPAPYLNAYLLTGNTEIKEMYQQIVQNPDKLGNFKKSWNEFFLLNEDIMEKLENLDQDATEVNEDVADNSFFATGRGLVLHKNGSGRYRRSLFMHYGNNYDCHNNRDTLGLQLFGYDRIIISSLGYPDLTKSRMHAEWFHSAVANNLVVVDKQSPLRKAQIVESKMFTECQLASLSDIDAGRVYPNCKRYRRLSGMVNITPEDFYVVDFFEVEGGKEHIYSFHTADGTVINESNIKFVTQTGGTYAAENIKYGDEIKYNSPYNIMHRWGNGLSWLYDIKRSQPVDSAQFVWKLKNTHNVSSFGDRVHVGFSLLTPVNELALAKGVPPQNRKGNPESIPYLLAKREGESEEMLSDFIAIIDPFLAGNRAIKHVSLLSKINGGKFSRGLRVFFKNGASDIILCNAGFNETATYDNGASLTGRFALLRLDKTGNIRECMTSGASEVSYRSYRKKFVAALNGTVASFSKGVGRRNITLDENLILPQGVIFPLHVHVKTKNKCVDTAYTIEQFSNNPDGTVLDCGEGSFINGANYSNVWDIDSSKETFKYDFDKKDKVIIPLSFYEKYQAN